MKRMLALTLAALLVLSLCACGPKVEVEKEEAPAWEGKFAVGYGRADVTPDYPVVMKGYTAAGEPARMSENILSHIYFTCIAMTDESGKTLLLYTYDCIMLHDGPDRKIRTAVAEATGVPFENIVISSTHSHSTPDHTDPFLSEAMEGAIKAAQDALADRAAATAEYSSAEVARMTFVRHYNTTTGIVVGSNFHPDGAGTRTSHTTEADKELRAIRLTRENKKPILLVNWMGHNSMASTGMSEFGKTHRNFISADYVGFCRDYVESNSDYHFALFMGASGNLGTSSRLSGETLTDNAIEYGNILGQHVLDATATMTTGVTGAINIATTQFTGTKGNMDINAIGIGSIGIITAPFEMFDTTSMGVREKSPYDVTFVLTIANGYHSYMPTEECFGYKECYEVRISQFNPGDAERIVDIYLDLLSQTKA